MALETARRFGADFGLSSADLAADWREKAARWRRQAGELVERAQAIEASASELMRTEAGEVVDQVLVPGVQPVSLAARNCQVLAARRAARRNGAAPAGGLFDDLARDQLDLFGRLS